MRVRPWLGTLLILAQCAAPAGPVPQTASAPSGFCRIGPDDGPPVSLAAGGDDRGIGGTGRMAAAGEDRGIGGTGIIGVVTGFASICVSGVEVGYAPDVPVRIEGVAATPAALRAGQVVVVEAEGGTDLRARHVAVRHEVSGPVESLGPGGVLSVAGQDVVAGEGTRGISPQPGDWVEVSGLRRADGTVVATRIDLGTPGVVRVHGELRRGDDGSLRIGRLPLREAGALDLEADRYATVSGTLRGGVLLAQSIQPDPVLRDPAAAFAPDVGRVLLESFVAVSGGALLLGSSVSTGFDRTLHPMPGRSVVELRRDAGGGLVARSLRPVPEAPAAASSQMPALPSAVREPGRPGTGGAPNAGDGRNGGARWEPAPVPGRWSGGNLNGPTGSGGAAGRSLDRGGYGRDRPSALRPQGALRPDGQGGDGGVPGFGGGGFEAGGPGSARGR
ncbi:DUF5666 domain-containing protein [Roseomonas elaeocarpi]|uniref:DUF5666 domain-containing protein n=1 Tax=Roseomonas elaeocarpi TaxID=907779 RepID=A0ABV6JR43_9PROT